jgi:sortase A
MRPDENRPATPLSVPARQQASINSSRMQGNKDAAANIVRSQIDTIYQNDPNATMEVGAQPTANPVVAKPEPKPAEPAPVKSPITAGPGAVNMQAANQQAETSNPYERTHDESNHGVQQPEAWRKYHSAWQSYYQQYYERYYVGQVHNVKKSLEKDAKVSSNDDPETISSDEAMYDLRSKLRNQINERAQKVRKSRHFLPVISALCVMLVFVFLQYNRLMFAAIDAYISPGSLDPSTLIVDPSAAGDVSGDPRLIVPKISVDVPIIWNANAASEDSLNAAMDKGVAWFNIQGASAKPGEKGNFALSGHSSNDWLDQGNYKFIFARLEQLNEGDTIYVNYNSTRYVYTVSKKQVVKPTDVSALAVGTDKPRITLITCTPLGTALNRLLVFADQVSPDPNSATQADTQSSSGSATQMPSNSPTFLERLFGAH